MLKTPPSKQTKICFATFEQSHFQRICQWPKLLMAHQLSNEYVWKKISNFLFGAFVVVQWAKNSQDFFNQSKSKLRKLHSGRLLQKRINQRATAAAATTHCWVFGVFYSSFFALAMSGAINCGLRKGIGAHNGFGAIRWSPFQIGVTAEVPFNWL